MKWERPQKPTKDRLRKQVEVNVILICELDNSDGKNPTPEPKGQLQKILGPIFVQKQCKIGADKEATF